MDEKQTVGKQIGDWGRRWQLLWAEAPLEKRFFGAAELFCFPVSLLTVFGFLPLQIFCSHLRLPLPPVWSGAVLPVLLSAAIGYLTNYIAIEMLFKPYERNKLHPFSLLTGTYWQQGLVPRNKHAVGVELGKQMEQLLDPQQISTDLCNMAVGFVQDERIVTALCGQLQTLLRHHEDSIIAFLQPRLERSLTEILDQLITTEQLKRVWLADLAPILTAPENRRAVCDSLIGALDRKTPQLINLFKTMVRESAQEFLKQHIPFGLGSESLADGLVGNIDWDAVEDRLKQKLQEEESRRMIDAELLADCHAEDETQFFPARLSAGGAAGHHRQRHLLGGVVEMDSDGIAAEFRSAARTADPDPGRGGNPPEIAVGRPHIPGGRCAGCPFFSPDGQFDCRRAPRGDPGARLCARRADRRGAVAGALNVIDF